VTVANGNGRLAVEVSDDGVGGADIALLPAGVCGSVDG
jgi:hypothetical protein